MIALFVTQRETLSPFATPTALATERFRLSPRCDFSRPPHPGPLWYERLGFPVTYEAWRERALIALARRGLPEDAGWAGT